MKRVGSFLPMNDIRTLMRHRQLIAALTSRDLKARYRGSILGFFWSLANPLLLLAVYTLVFTVFFKQTAVTPYPLRALLPCFADRRPEARTTATPRPHHLRDQGVGRRRHGGQG